MKHHHLFIIIYFLIALSPCDAMEKKNILTHLIFNNIEKITAVEKPRRARLLANNHAVIIDEKQDTYRVNLETKASQKINHSYSKENLSIPILQIDNDKIITCCGKTAVIYNAHTGVKEWSKTTTTTIQSLAWNEAQNTIFLCHYPEHSRIRNKIEKYNYITDDCEKLFTEDRQYKFITIHPKEETICLISNNGSIYWHILNNTNSTHKKLPIPNDGKEGTESSFSCQYNSDGSYLATGYTNKIKIVDHNKKPNSLLYLSAPKGEFFEEILAQANETFHQISLHPNNSILAILCSYESCTIPGITHKKQYVRYYNVKTLQCIDQTIEFDSRYNHDLAFSLDGFAIIVTLENECVKIPVVFAIKEKCLYTLLSLNYCKDKDEHILPQDIKHYIINTLIKSIVYS
jgi:hypothetical protein